MSNVVTFILAGLQITLLDIVLSGDNVGVIALAIRKLDKKQAKLASMVGIAGAIGLRILFASIITLIMEIEWLPIRLLGGLLLVKITWDLIKDDKSEESGDKQVKSANGFWAAVTTIILADISMSLDNVLAIGGTAGGEVGLIIFGIALNIPIIFFGTQIVSKLMERFKIVIYLGGAILIRTAIAMMTEDNLVNGYLNNTITTYVPWLFAVGVMIYGLYKIGVVKVRSN